MSRSLPLQVSSSNATTISQPILQLSGDTQAQVAQVAQGQDMNAAGQTLQSVQLVNPGTFLIQAQTVTATGQIQWQTFQVTYEKRGMLCLHAVKDARLLKRVPSVSVGSGCPVAPGAPAAPGAGAGPAAHLSPGSDPPSGSDGPGQPAQPPDSHSELCNTIWNSVHTRGRCKQSSWYGKPAHTLHPHTLFNM